MKKTNDDSKLVVGMTFVLWVCFAAPLVVACMQASHALDGLIIEGADHGR